MEIEQLQGMAEHLLELGVEQLRRTGALNAMFNLVRSDGGIEVVVVDGRLINDRQAKAIISKQAADRAAAGELQAILFMSDIYFGQVSAANEKIRAALGLDVEQSAALGLCDKQEAVMVVLDSPIIRELRRQIYQRDQQQKLITLGPCEVTRENDAEFAGQFINFFKRRPAARA